MDYIKQQQILLRSTKKQLYRAMQRNGYKTDQSSQAQAAKELGLYYSSEATRFQCTRIIESLYSTLPLPLASSKTDLYYQNNLICCCLLCTIEKGTPTGLSSTPMFVQKCSDLGLRLEIQSIVYSRLLEILEKKSLRVPRTQYEELFSKITDLEQRIERLEANVDGTNT